MFASTAAQRSPRSSPRTSAIARIVSGTRYDALVRPRWGIGREVRRVGLDQHPVPGGDRSASRSGSAFLNVTVPAKLRWAPRSRQAAREGGVAGEAVHHPPLGRALLVEHPQHVVVGVAVVDHQGLVEPLGQVDVPAERLLLHGPPLLAGAEGVEPGLPHRAHLVVRLGQRLDLGHAPRRGRAPAAPRWGAARRRPRARRASPRPRPPSARRAGRSRSGRSAVRRPPPPAASASSTGSAGSSPRPMSRWQWLSTTGCGSGSGAGGRSVTRRHRADPVEDRLGQRLGRLGRDPVADARAA